jgi:hypothetical protein
LPASDYHRRDVTLQRPTLIAVAGPNGSMTQSMARRKSSLKRLPRGREPSLDDVCKHAADKLSP